MTVKNKHTRILIFLVCIILGYMITMQLRSHNQYQNLAIQRAEDLTVRLKEVQADRDKLAKELDEYRAGRIYGAAQKEMDDLKARAGETEMEGKGIVFTLDDSKQAAKTGENKNLYIIHDEDLLRVVNELRAAGAEAISLHLRQPYFLPHLWYPLRSGLLPSFLLRPLFSQTQRSVFL